MKNNNHFLAGAIFGGIIGGLTALALSPKTGKEFRQNVMDKLAYLKENTDLQNSEADKGKQNQTIKLNQENEDMHTKEEPSYIALEQQIDKMIDSASNEKNKNLDIQKMLEETKNAFTEVEQKL